jgi:hypothetical protein
VRRSGVPSALKNRAAQRRRTDDSHLQAQLHRFAVSTEKRPQSRTRRSRCASAAGTENENDLRRSDVFEGPLAGPTPAQKGIRRRDQQNVLGLYITVHNCVRDRFRSSRMYKSY